MPIKRNNLFIIQVMKWLIVKKMKLMLKIHQKISQLLIILIVFKIKMKSG
jgi:hypothetical protein